MPLTARHVRHSHEDVRCGRAVRTVQRLVLLAGDMDVLVSGMERDVALGEQGIRTGRGCSAHARPLIGGQVRRVTHVGQGCCTHMLGGMPVVALRYLIWPGPEVLVECGVLRGDDRFFGVQRRLGSITDRLVQVAGVVDIAQPYLRLGHPMRVRYAADVRLDVGVRRLLPGDLQILSVILRLQRLDLVLRMLEVLPSISGLGQTLLGFCGVNLASH